MSAMTTQLPIGIRLWREHRALLGRWIARHRREPIGIIGTIVQPVLWLLLFGNLLAKMAEGAAIPGGNYLRFMTAGAVVMTIYNASISGGVELLFDRESGLLVRMFAAPISRLSIVTSRFMYVVGLSCLQSLVILLAAMLMGVRYETGLLGIAGCLVFGALFGAGITSLSVVMAFGFRNHGDFFTVTGFLSLPLIFLSSALIPLDLMPAWLAALASINPMTYAIEAVRALTLVGWSVSALLPAVGVLVLFDVICIAAATWVFRWRLTR